MPSAARQPPPHPLGFAHRGARGHLPDNTIPGFAAALEAGAAGLESDVWVTADGVAVLDHDGVVRRGVRRVPIAGVPRHDLPGHIPTLAELYATCGTDFELSLDVKTDAAAAVAVRAAEAAGADGRLWLCGSGAALAAWRALSPAVTLVESTRRARLGPDPAGALRSLAADGVGAVNLRWRDWDAPLVGAVHDAGMWVLAWDAHRYGVVADLLDLGVDGVFGDFPWEMIAAIEAHRRARPDP